MCTINRYFIVCFFSSHQKYVKPTLEDHTEISTNSVERAGRSLFVNSDDRSEDIQCCIPNTGVMMAVICTQGSFRSVEDCSA